jgi:hypothetical protein
VFSDPPTLAEFGAYAQEALEMLDRQTIPDSDQARAAYDEIVKAAREVEARVDAPMTIGFVGEYNVGKSLLLGTLLGDPGLLPVEEGPATGNITVLRLAPGPRGSDTRAGATAEIRFLSDEQFSASFRSVLAELVKEVDHDNPELGAGEILGGDYDPLGDRGWAPFNAWVPRLWGVTRSGPPGVPGLQAAPAERTRPVADAHKGAVGELCLMRDAFLNQVGLVGGRITVGTDVIRAALALPTAQRVPELPPKRQTFTLNSVGLGRPATAAQQLRLSFPLIERVLLEVSVSPDHWPLAGLLAEHEVQILDFPGIGAAGSYGRDAYLSRRELVDVHTILLVLRTGRAEAAGANAFWTMLKNGGRGAAALEDAALVVANAFDLAHVPSFPGDGPLPLPSFLKEAREANGIHTYAPRYVGRHEDRIQAVSPVAAIDRLGLGLDGLSANTRARVDDVLTSLRGAPPGRWEPIAARLAAADPDNPWTPRLRAFEEDGGISALQQLMVRHVSAHGTSQKLERAGVPKQELARQVALLRREVHRNEGGDDAAAYVEIGSRLGTVKLQIDKRLLPELARLRVAGGPVYSDEPQPPSPADTAAAMRDEVYDWPEWQQLLERAFNDRGRLVTRSEKREPQATRIPRTRFPGQSAPADGVSVGSGDGTPGADGSEVFIQKFVQLVEERTARDRLSLLEWLAEWGERWGEEFDPQAKWWQDPDVAARMLELYTRRRGSVISAEEKLGELWQALDARTNAQAIALELHPPGEEARERWAGHFPALPGHALP